MKNKFSDGGCKSNVEGQEIDPDFDFSSSSSALTLRWGEENTEVLALEFERNENHVTQ